MKYVYTDKLNETHNVDSEISKVLQTCMNTTIEP